MSAYSDGGAARTALDGVHTLFMVSAFESPTRVPEHRTFIDAAVAAGVRHLVYTSFYGAAEDATFIYARDHWQTEQHLRARGAAGLQWTFLRDNFYADFLLELVGQDNVLRGPAGDGRVAAVAQDDIADAAVAVLLDAPAHAGRTYDLTGPQSLTLAEVARILSAATGRHHLLRRDPAGGAGVACRREHTRLARRRVDLYLHRHLRRRGRRDHERRPRPDRAPGYQPRGTTSFLPMKGDARGTVRCPRTT